MIIMPKQEQKIETWKDWFLSNGYIDKRGKFALVNDGQSKFWVLYEGLCEKIQDETVGEYDRWCRKYAIKEIKTAVEILKKDDELINQK